MSVVMLQNINCFLDHSRNNRTTAEVLTTWSSGYKGSRTSYAKIEIDDFELGNLILDADLTSSHIGPVEEGDRVDVVIHKGVLGYRWWDKKVED